MTPLADYPVNPAYGTGAYRRRIRLWNEDGAVSGQLDDNNHALWMRLFHDGARITGTDGGFSRWPTTGCVSAADGLRSLIGMELGTGWLSIYGEGQPRGACTHMFDLAALGIAQAARPTTERVWDVIVPDEGADGLLDAELLLDGERVHHWRLRDMAIAEPAELGGQDVLRGFMPWALARFEGDALEGAIVLRMGLFVARARTVVPDTEVLPLSRFTQRHGVCYAYSSPRFERALQRMNTVRDFSDGLVEGAPPPPLRR